MSKHVYAEWKWGKRGGTLPLTIPVQPSTSRSCVIRPADRITDSSAFKAIIFSLFVYTDLYMNNLNVFKEKSVKPHLPNDGHWWTFMVSSTDRWDSSKNQFPIIYATINAPLSELWVSNELTRKLPTLSAILQRNDKKITCFEAPMSRISKYLQKPRTHYSLHTGERVMNWWAHASGVAPFLWSKVDVWKLCFSSFLIRVWVEEGWTGYIPQA